MDKSALKTIIVKYKRLISLLLGFLFLVSALFLIHQAKYRWMLSLTADELWENPLPVPAFVSSFETAPTNDKGATQNICADIVPNALWRLGNTSGNLATHIVSTLEITVDDYTLVPEQIYTMVYLTEGGKTDPFGLGINLGTVGGAIVTCFDVSNLPDGLHKVTLRTETTLGEKYFFAWAFKLG